ncbi:MAG: hypothetical protein II888_00865 [Clostridia bacterium]|nr:hypothetical protein [Clostridia bacterium]
MKLTEKLRYVHRWYYSVWKKPSYYHIGLANKVKYAIRGFNENEYVWYHLGKNDYREYISDFERVTSRSINGEYKAILDNKLIFYEVFRSYIRVPEVYGWISAGQVYGLHQDKLNSATFISFLKEKGRTVIKWERGYEGKGTYVIKYKSMDDFDVNGETVTASQLLEECTGFGDAILTEYIQQSEFENELYPYTTNSLRIVCGKCKGEQKMEIIKAVQRIGNQVSRPVDNVSQGAISSEIDVETGILGPCYIAKSRAEAGKKRKPDEIKIESFTKHPDTGAQISGRTIPQWKNIRNEIEKLSNKFPYLSMVGWDVLLTDDGFCVLEGNASAGCTMFQMEHGIRREKIGDIYRSFGIIKS